MEVFGDFGKRCHSAVLAWWVEVARGEWGVCIDSFLSLLSLGQNEGGWLSWGQIALSLYTGGSVLERGRVGRGWDPAPEWRWASLLGSEDQERRHRGLAGSPFSSERLRKFQITCFQRNRE